MLRADEIEALRDAASDLLQPVINYLLRDIAERIAKAGQLTATAQYETWKLQQLGVSQRDLRNYLKKALKVSNAKLRQLLTQSAEAGYNYDLSSLPTVRAIPFDENEAVQQIVRAAIAQTQGTLENLTQTLGMVDPYGHVNPLRDTYRKCMDYAFEQVSSGAVDYNTAIREATRNLAAKGVEFIDYESGVTTSLEAAVRRNIMGALGLMQEQISQYNHDQYGATGWEIDAHSNSAPDHEPIQGKQYTDAEYEVLNNSLVRRIGTLNCGHSAHPIAYGASIPQYTPEELEEMRQKNEKGITFRGKHYTGYEATQKQRRLERAIRAQKRKILIDKAIGDSEKLETDQIKLQLLQQDYKAFSKAAGLRTQHERLEKAGYSWVEETAAQKPLMERPKGNRTSTLGATFTVQRKTVAEAGNPAIIKTTDTKGGNSVHHVGKIDIGKYRCVSENITTDEVIITDERIQHIKERHPEDFERYERYMAGIVESPDYILEANKPNTAFLLKEFVEDNERFQLILRLAVQGDPAGYKNSVITFLKVEGKRYKRYLRTKNILYKSE